jgi:large subunit ribosomal protein L29
MTKNKLKELRELSRGDLEKMRGEIEANMRVIRFKSKIERPSNPLEKRNLRKKIAVINTIIREMEIKAAKTSGKGA